MVGVHSPATRALVPLEFTIDVVVRNVNLPAPVAVNGAESLVAAGRLGLGLIQGAARSRRRRFGAGNARSRPARLPTLADTGLAALSSESAAFTVRPRVHRLARPRVAEEGSLTLAAEKRMRWRAPRPARMSVKGQTATSDSFLCRSAKASNAEIAPIANRLPVR
jgi:hypothetical protein